jgi:hypothetical protein
MIMRGKSKYTFKLGQKPKTSRPETNRDQGDEDGDTYREVEQPTNTAARLVETPALGVLGTAVQGRKRGSSEGS